MGEVHQLLVELAVGHAVLEGEAVVLDLDVEVTGGKELLERAGPLERLVGLAVQDVARDDARHARRGADDALRVLAEHVERGAGLVVEAAHRRVAHHLHEVDVARLVLGEQDHVVELGLLVARERVVRREVGLAAKDGLDERGGLHRVDVAAGVVAGDVSLPLGVGLGLGVGVGLVDLAALGIVVLVVEPLLPVCLGVIVLGRGKVKVGHAVHVAVVGDGHGGHLLVHGALHHVGDAGGAVEHGVVRVVVQVCEGHASPLSSIEIEDTATRARGRGPICPVNEKSDRAGWYRARDLRENRKMTSSHF